MSTPGSNRIESWWARRKPGAPTVTALAVFLAAAGVSTALILRGEQYRVQDLRLRVAGLASDHAHAIQTGMERALSATYALAAMVRQARGEIADFEGVAGEMLPLYPGVAALGLAPNGIVRRVAPLAGNERSVGFNQLADPVQGREAFIAKQSGKLTLSGPLMLVQGGLGAIGRLPIYLDDANGQPQFWGFTYAVCASRRP